MAFGSPAHCFNETQLIFKRLSSLLADRPCLFGRRVTSLDILAHAYLKTLLVNASQSKEAACLQHDFPKLYAFVDRITKLDAEKLRPKVP